MKSLLSDNIESPKYWVPKVDWSIEWDVNRLLAEYGYTEDEIKCVLSTIEDYKNGNSVPNLDFELDAELYKNVRSEYHEQSDTQYGTLSIEQRKQLDSVNTTPKNATEMSMILYELIKDDIDSYDILDMTCGAGNLIASILITGGTDENGAYKLSNSVYGNDLELEYVKLARERLTKFKVNANHIHQGDASINWKSITKNGCNAMFDWEDDYTVYANHYSKEPLF